MNPPAPHDLDQLLATLRHAQPDTARAAYAFETRLLARLQEERSSSVETWAARLWPIFAALALITFLWSQTADRDDSPDAPLWAELAHASDERRFLTLLTGTEDPAP